MRVEHRQRRRYALGAAALVSEKEALRHRIIEGTAPHGRDETMNSKRLCALGTALVLVAPALAQQPYQAPPYQAPPQYQQAPPQYQQAPPQYQQAPPQYQQAPPQYQQAPPQYQQAPPQYQ